MKRYYLIACAILQAELNAVLQAVSADTSIETKIMPDSLHEAGTAKMKQTLQAELDCIDPAEYDAILLCYGLCSNGIVGLSAAIPLVVPRAHDCIALLMGSKVRYQQYFEENPGTFFQSPGWIEKDVDGENLQGGNENAFGLLSQKELYIEQYGEEEGLYLYEMLGGWKSEYKQLTYIDTVKETAIDYAAKAKQIADKYQWRYQQIEGDTRLLFHLLNGDWDAAAFLVLPPHQKIAPSYDDTIITY